MGIYCCCTLITYCCTLLLYSTGIRYRFVHTCDRHLSSNGYLLLLYTVNVWDKEKKIPHTIVARDRPKGSKRSCHTTYQVPDCEDEKLHFFLVVSRSSSVRARLVHRPPIPPNIPNPRSKSSDMSPQTYNCRRHMHTHVKDYYIITLLFEVWNGIYQSVEA